MLDQEFVQFDCFVNDLSYDRELEALVHDLLNDHPFPYADDHVEVVSVVLIHWAESFEKKKIIFLI